MTRTKSIYLALVAVMFSPAATYADIIYTLRGFFVEMGSLLILIAHNLDQIDSLEKWPVRREADSEKYYYVGITGRNWLLRLSEHIGEMRRATGLSS